MNHDLIKSLNGLFKILVADSDYNIQTVRSLVDELNFNVSIGNGIENFGFKDADGDAEGFGIVLDFPAVNGVIAGIHDEELDIERDFAVPLEPLHTLCHEHGILAAGDADGDAVALLDEVIFADTLQKLCPDRSAEFADDGFFNLIWYFHNPNSFPIESIDLQCLLYSVLAGLSRRSAFLFCKLCRRIGLLRSEAKSCKIRKLFACAGKRKRR